MDRYSRESLRKKYLYRFGYTVALLLSAFIFPYWATVTLALVGIVIFTSYAESILPLLLIDLVYGIPGRGVFGYQFGATAVLLLFFCAFEYGIKPHITYYDKE